MTVKILSISLNDGRFILFLSLSGYSVVPEIEPKTILNNKRPIEKFLSGFSWFIIDVIGIYCPERLYPAIFLSVRFLCFEEQILLLLYSVLLSTSITWMLKDDPVQTILKFLIIFSEPVLAIRYMWCFAQFGTNCAI